MRPYGVRSRTYIGCFTSRHQSDRDKNQHDDHDNARAPHLVEPFVPSPNVSVAGSRAIRDIAIIP